MRSLHNYIKRQKGFTIVELLIVIVIIGILATLVIVTFSGIQQRARDTQRQTDINAIQSQVEAYNAQTGTYPTLQMLNDDNWRNENMKGFPRDALFAPGQKTDGDDGEANKPGSGASTTAKYQYLAWTEPTVPEGDAEGTPCVTDGVVSVTTTSNCQSYKITAALESGTEAYVKSSN